ncbi:MAG: putative metal-binding motif-containing protein [Myxococcota bacterium]|jgi:hypothetical protein|nr:putative metal-binding motif-containing protein [Myxococcota bacterium]
MDCEQVMPGVDLTCRQVVCNSSNGSCDLVVLRSGADDDSDSALDKACGGDDCDDADATKKPGAAEVCDLKDNDCDGLTDISGSFAPLELDTGDDGSLRRPVVATDGEHLVVAWQRGSGTEGDIRVVFLSAGGQPVTGQASLAVLLGIDKGLSMPTLASAEGKVLLGFAQGQGSDTRLEVVGLRADLAGTAIDLPNLEVDSGRPILDLALAEDPKREGGSEFAVLYCALAEDGQQEVLAATPFDMESIGPALLSRGELGEVELELLRTAPHRFVAAMAMRALSTDSTEVWTADLLSEEPEPTQGTLPLLLSSATSGLADTSSSPRAALVGSRVLVSWRDIAKASGGFSVEPDSDVRAAFLDAPSTIVGLVNDVGVNQRPWGAVALGSGLGLLFTQTTAAGAMLDFRSFDSDMKAVGQQAGRIAHVSQGALEASRLLQTSEGLAVAWVTSVASGDALRFLAFSACEVP